VFVIAEHTNRVEKSGGGSDSPALAAAGAKVPKGETPRHSFSLPLAQTQDEAVKFVSNELRSKWINRRSRQVRVYKGLLYFRAARTNNKD
jgi:hypothetical protein